jgi:hypothetical protein
VKEGIASSDAIPFLFPEHFSAMDLSLKMPSQITLLRAELDAINYWDDQLVENPEPGVIDQQASIARFFRRVQVLAQLQALATRN